MNKHAIEMAEDIRDNEFSDAGPELANTILAIANKTEPIRTRLYSLGLQHKNTSRLRVFKRAALEHEVRSLAIEFFLAATADAEAPASP